MSTATIHERRLLRTNDMLRQGLGMDAIADCLGLARSTLNVSLWRARKALNETPVRSTPALSRATTPILSPEPAPCPPTPAPFTIPAPAPRERVLERRTPRPSLRNLRSTPTYVPDTYEQELPGPRPSAEDDADTLIVKRPRLEVPPMTPGAREHVLSDAHLEEIAEAYWNPQHTHTQRDGQIRQWAGTVELVVAPDAGLILAIHEHVAVAPGLPEFLTPVRRASGGKVSRKGGKQLPKTLDDFWKRLGRAGATHEKAGSGHWKIKHADRPDVYVTVGATHSDHRGIHNDCANVRNVLGIDLRDWAK